MSESLPVLEITKRGLEIVPCALCRSTATRPYCTKFGYSIVKCRACGLVYCNPRLTSAETDKRYSADYFHGEYLPSVIPPNGPDDGAFLDLRFKAALTLLADGGPPGRLVEIGTGAGFFLKAAVRAGFDAYGLDLSTEAASYARNTLGLRVIETSAEDMPFEAGYFAAAAMFEVIEHLRDPMRVLRAAHRALRSGGVLLLSTPNLDALSRRVLGRQWSVLSPAEHLYYFTEATLTRALTQVGFREVTFIRNWEPWLHFETTNPYSTHTPGSWRARIYERLVLRYGPHYFRDIQRRGLADGLMCMARV